MEIIVNAEESEEIVVVNKTAYEDLIRENEKTNLVLNNLNQRAMDYFYDKAKGNILFSYIKGMSRENLKKLVSTDGEHKIEIVTTSIDMKILKDASSVLTRESYKLVINRLCKDINSLALSTLQVLDLNQPGQVIVEKKENK